VVVLFALLSIGIAAPTTQWYTQKLDHFSGDQRTWKQKYYVDDSLWGGVGSPIFVYIGGEGPLGPRALTNTILAKSYAPTFGALMFALEHRFYGESQPLPDWTVESLQYLSSQQALADLAAFIVDMQNQYAANSSPVIVFGGSYPGNLAAWFRIKFPDIAIAAVASSAPVYAELDFFQYLDVVDRSLSYFAGPECDAKIAAANKQIALLFHSQQGTLQVEQMFNTCSNFNGQNDIATFASTLMGNFMGTVQYDNEINGAPTIDTLCDVMLTNSSDPVTAYAAVSDLFLRSQGMSCLDISYYDSMVSIVNTSSNDVNNMRQWTYQTCVEFGYFQTTDDNQNQPFGDFVPLSYYTQQCVEAFNITDLPDVNFTNAYYGGKDPKGATNILFVNGSLDPWHALSITQTNLPGIATILINGTAHCADMSPAKSTDPPGLAQAQAQILNQLGVWLGPTSRLE